MSRKNPPRRIKRSMWNHHWLGWPLTGPDAITTRYPVAGSLTAADGRVLLIAEGETCRATGPGDWVDICPDNVIEPESERGRAG